MKIKNDKYKKGSKKSRLEWTPKYTLLPQGIRGLIIGKSGCSKTTLVINLLLRPGWFDYNNTNKFGKSLFQPEYHILKKAFEEKIPTQVIIRLSKTKTK